MDAERRIESFLGPQSRLPLWSRVDTVSNDDSPINAVRTSRKLSTAIGVVRARRMGLFRNSISLNAQESELKFMPKNETRGERKENLRNKYKEKNTLFTISINKYSKNYRDC
ncbi:hypothetical protein Zmor_024211 [Zophobas morio]|uniref:Uncharacterized protein n=1 Tax=Zophobas morio TaxID=2755281 RepID=A0AA38I2N6_9CUCU|nr:hypothetical protein Zmor_024211 [Zophobas morio]